jgi:predicted transcriptional regulator of viral defense system
VRQGGLARVGRGLYALSDRKVSEYSALADVACKHPRAIVCLLSALRFHEVTTRVPFEVWLAIRNKVHAPRLDDPYRSGPLRIVR